MEGVVYFRIGAFPLVLDELKTNDRRSVYRAVGFEGFRDFRRSAEIFELGDDWVRYAERNGLVLIEAYVHVLWFEDGYLERTPVYFTVVVTKEFFENAGDPIEAVRLAVAEALRGRKLL